MGRYLDKFLSIVPERQSRQVLEILGKLKDKGAIKSIEEYSDKLQELTTTLKSTDPVPAFNLFQAAVGDEISSDIHNAMTEAAAMDIETAFQEAQNVGNVLEMHKDIFRITVLENLQKSIATLSSKLKLYQFLADSHDGFAYTQFNTFDNIDTPQTPRNNLENSLYFDYNKNEPVPAEEDAQVNKQAQSLELASIGGSISIVDIHAVEGDDTTVSVLDLASVTQGQPNTIDGKEDTHWVYPVILAERISTGATLKMRLDLGGIRRINSIYIDAAVKYPMTLTKVAYLPQAAESGSPTATVFSGETSVFLPMRVSFASINAQFIELTFTQKSWEETRYWVDQDLVAGNDDFVDGVPPEAESDTVGATSEQPPLEETPTDDDYGMPPVVAENIALLVKSAAKEADQVATVAAQASNYLLDVSNTLAQAAAAADLAANTKSPAEAVAAGEIAVSLAEEITEAIAMYVGSGGVHYYAAKKMAEQARRDIDEAKELLELTSTDDTDDTALDDVFNSGAGSRVQTV